MSILSYVVSTNGTEVSVACSDGRSQTMVGWSELITFLLSSSSFSTVWNLESFIDIIKQIFPQETIKEMEKNERFYFPDNTKFFYSIGRTIGITYGGQEVNFYAISRYFPEVKEPTDPQEIAVMTDKVVDAFKVFGITPSTLASPVSVYSGYLGELYFPRSCDLPDEAIFMTDEASKYMTQEWRELFKIGHWQQDEVSDVDICSAYGSIISRLPDISKAAFFESDTLPDKYDFGILEGNVEVVRDVSPFQDIDGYHRKGLIKDQVITSGGLWLLRKYGGNFEMKHGWFLKLPGAVTYPFRQTMANLFTIRDHPNEIVSNIAKGISVGIYGVLAQRYENKDGSWKLGKNFNSIYALMTTSQCSLMIADYIYSRNLDTQVISVTVDGILHEGSSDCTREKQFGKFRLNEPTPFLVASMLNQWGGDRHPNMMFYSDMVDAAKAHPKSSSIFDVDLNLLEYNREFKVRPKNWGELLTKKFSSEPY